MFTLVDVRTVYIPTCSVDVTLLLFLFWLSSWFRGPFMGLVWHRCHIWSVVICFSRCRPLSPLPVLGAFSPLPWFDFGYNRAYYSDKYQQWSNSARHTPRNTNCWWIIMVLLSLLYSTTFIFLPACCLYLHIYRHIFILFDFTFLQLVLVDFLNKAASFSHICHSGGRWNSEITGSVFICHH